MVTDEIAEQIKSLQQKADAVNEMVKLLLVTQMMENAHNLLDTDGIITRNAVDAELQAQFETSYALEMYQIEAHPFVLMKPLHKMKMQQMHQDYCKMTEQGMTCVLVFEKMSGYEVRRCRELGLNRLDLFHRELYIRYGGI